MKTINHQPIDKSYKFMNKRLGIRFHRYFFEKNGDKIVFLDNEISDTGQRRDITYKLDNKSIFNVEFQSKAIYDDKMNSIFEYHESLRCDKNNRGISVFSGVISTANPNWGISEVKIDDNLTFHPTIIFTKEINGWKVLSTIINKIISNDELSDKQAIDLLILPDMNIDMPIKALMSLICFLISHANIMDENFKEDIILCEIMVLKRFFDDEELSKRVAMLRYETENPERMKVISKYGQGFDLIYFDGKSDGINQSKWEIAKKLIALGIDVETIAKGTGLTIDQIKELKRKL